MSDTELRLRALLGQYVHSHDEAVTLRCMEERGCYCPLCLLADTLGIPPISPTWPIEDAMALVLSETETAEEVQP